MFLLLSMRQSGTWKHSIWGGKLSDLNSFLSTSDIKKQKVIRLDPFHCIIIVFCSKNSNRTRTQLHLAKCTDNRLKSFWHFLVPNQTPAGRSPRLKTTENTWENTLQWFRLQSNLILKSALMIGISLCCSYATSLPVQATPLWTLFSGKWRKLLFNRYRMNKELLVLNLSIRWCPIRGSRPTGRSQMECLWIASNENDLKFKYKYNSKVCSGEHVL